MPDCREFLPLGMNEIEDFYRPGDLTRRIEKFSLLGIVPSIFGHYFFEIERHCQLLLGPFPVFLFGFIVLTLRRIGA